MKTWLKGGLIGGILAIINLILFFSCTFIFWESHAGASCMFLEILPILLLIPMSPLNNYIAFPLITLLNLVIFFIIGSLIGHIIQKIKTKNT
jgi:hypothetical protein